MSVTCRDLDTVKKSSPNLMIAFLCAASLSSAAVLPDGPGKAETM
jgi:hypothetical protein